MRIGVEAAKIAMNSRAPKHAIRVVVEPDLSVRYGSEDGARIEGTVTERWGRPTEGFQRNDRRKVTTVSQPYQ